MSFKPMNHLETCVHELLGCTVGASGPWQKAKMPEVRQSWAAVCLAFLCLPQVWWSFRSSQSEGTRGAARTNPAQRHREVRGPEHRV